MLRAVGNPVAVNPDVSLFRAAKARRWPVEDWSRTQGTPGSWCPRGSPLMLALELYRSVPGTSRPGPSATGCPACWPVRSRRSGW